jgi:hypothetical protein
VSAGLFDPHLVPAAWFDPDLAGGLFDEDLTEASSGGGTLAATLGAITASSAGTVAVAGTAAPTLGAVTSSSAGTVAIVGAASPTLDAVVSAATGTYPVDAGPQTLYLRGATASAPYPTTSAILSTTIGAGATQSDPGYFDNGAPGGTDSGAWTPGAAVAETDVSTEIDNTGAALGTTRAGWIWGQDLTGYTLAADAAWTTSLRLEATLGSGTSGRILLRVTVVTASGGVWTTVKNLLTTSINGATAIADGQAGWRENGARITVTSTPTTFTQTHGGAGTALGHTFAEGERILVELGFGDANSTADRTWRLHYGGAASDDSYIITPDLTPPPLTGSASPTLGALGLSATGEVTSAVATGEFAATLGALTSSSAGAVAVVGGASTALAGVSSSAAGEAAVTGAASPTLDAVTASSAGSVAIAGAAAASLAPSVLAATGAVAVVGASAATLGGLAIVAAGTQHLPPARVGLRQSSPYAVALSDALVAAVALAASSPHRVTASVSSPSTIALAASSPHACSITAEDV